VRRKQKPAEWIYKELKSKPNKVILTFQYPLDQDVSGQMVKNILSTYGNEIQDGIVDYYQRKKDGTFYFILFWTQEVYGEPL
jgi:hypothetical protein